MFSILKKPEATSSQAGEVTQLPEFPWRLLLSMLSELVDYKHLVLSARVNTFITIIQPGFMLHTFMHSKSKFGGIFFQKVELRGVHGVCFFQRFIGLFCLKVSFI